MFTCTIVCPFGVIAKCMRTAGVYHFKTLVDIFKLNNKNDWKNIQTNNWTKNSSRYNCKMLSSLYCTISVFSQKAEFLVLVFYFRGCSDNILAFHNFYQKVRNKKVRFLCSIFPKLTLTFTFSSTPSELRLTCTVVRPFGIVAIGIKAVRV